MNNISELNANKFLDENFWTKEEILNQYGPNYELAMGNSILVKNADLFFKYQKESLITEETQNGKITASEKLLRDLINNEGMYAYLIKNMDNYVGMAVVIKYFFAGEIISSIQITRADIAILLSKLDKKSLSIREQMRISLIHSLTSFSSCLKRFTGLSHSTLVEDEVITVNIDTLLEILSLSDEDYEAFLSGEKEYFCAKEKLAFMLVDFIERERIFDKYILTPKMYNRYKSIRAYEVIDFESLNKYYKSNDTDYLTGKSFLDDIQIDSSLENAIYQGCSEYFSPLERAIFAHIKLCQLLNIKNEPKKNPLKKHFDKIPYITLENNMVNQMEYALIYAKLIQKLGIRYSFDKIFFISENNALDYLSGEYMVHANFSGENLLCDQEAILHNEPFSSLKSQNSNHFTKQKFEELLYKVYTYVLQYDRTIYEFATNVKKLNELHEDEDYSIKDRVFMFMKIVGNLKFYGLDNLIVQEQLFKNLFGDNKDIDLKFLVKKEYFVDEFLCKPLSVISYHPNENGIFFIINPSSLDQYQTLTFKEMETLVKSNQYHVIANEYDFFFQKERELKKC